MNDYLDENIGCLGVIGIWAIVIAIIIIEPFITFGFGFLMGLILKITIGPLMVSGLAAMGITIALRIFQLYGRYYLLYQAYLSLKLYRVLESLKIKRANGRVALNATLLFLAVVDGADFTHAYGIFYSLFDIKILF